MSSLIVEKNLAQTFFKRVEQSSSRSAMIRKISGTWRTLTWLEYRVEVYKIASALQQEGVKRGDVVAIVSNSRPEWAWIDVATFCVGAVSVPVYPSLLAEDIRFILKDCGAKIVFVEDSGQKEKIEASLAELNQVARVIVLKDTPTTGEAFITMKDWLRKYNLSDKVPSNEEIAQLRALTATIEASEIASIVYTSGTSGQPKGVELRHSCFLGFIEGTERALGVSENDTTLLFLPMAHILGRVEHMLSLGVGWTNAYAENLKVMIDNLVEVRPTVLVSVPRIYEKIYSSVLGKLSKAGKVEKIIGDRAVAFASEFSRVQESGTKLDLLQRAQYAAFSQILYDKVKSRFGGRLRFCISGGAPFSQEISRFFHACGVLVLEGYGLTESTGPLTVNRPDDFRMGSVGKAMERIELKIAEDGEILARGASIMKGYHDNPQATSEAITEDGYFATGDIGRIDEEGFLFITDRKKDLIVTAGGKNIAPQKIESMLLEDPLFAQAMVVGDRQKYLGALVALHSGEARQLAKSQGIEKTRLEDLYADSKFQQLVFKRASQVNQRLASFESLKKISILPRELSVEEGEVTPSLKIKRKFCEKKYADLIGTLFT
ncbi:MAG: long-chain fatty acid--CoA ligase [Bdellovibrionota bacterium]